MVTQSAAAWAEHAARRRRAGPPTLSHLRVRTVTVTQPLSHGAKPDEPGPYLYSRDLRVTDSDRDAHWHDSKRHL